MFSKVEKKNLKKTIQVFKFPEFPIRRQSLPRIPHKAQIPKWWYP